MPYVARLTLQQPRLLFASLQSQLCWCTRQTKAQSEPATLRNWRQKSCRGSQWARVHVCVRECEFWNRQKERKLIVAAVRLTTQPTRHNTGSTASTDLTVRDSTTLLERRITVQMAAVKQSPFTGTHRQPVISRSHAHSACAGRRWAWPNDRCASLVARWRPSRNNDAAIKSTTHVISRVTRVRKRCVLAESWRQRTTCTNADDDIAHRAVTGTMQLLCCILRARKLLYTNVTLATARIAANYSRALDMM